MHFPGAFSWHDLANESDEFVDYWFQAACEQLAARRLAIVKEAEIMNVQSFGVRPLNVEIANLNVLFNRLAAGDLKFLERNLLRGV